jgi:hypothetical protein
MTTIFCQNSAQDFTAKIVTMERAKKVVMIHTFPLQSTIKTTKISKIRQICYFSAL